MLNVRFKIIMPFTFKFEKLSGAFDASDVESITYESIVNEYQWGF